MKRTLHTVLAAAAIFGISALSACDSAIFDNEGDCSVHYQVPFAYTKNIIQADAFASQVSKVTLLVFDKNGNLVLWKTESGDAVKRTGYKMDVELTPGTYDMLAWCEGASPMDMHTAFAIGDGTRPADFDAHLPLQEKDAAVYSDKDIVPLFHGMSTGVVCGKGDYGYIDLPLIDLTKDTNVIKVLLENLDGREMKESDFSIRITADNSEMNYLNEVVGEKAFEYRPWSLSRVSSERDEARASSTTVSGLFAECTMGRLMTDRKPMLIVTRCEDGKDIIKLDLVSALLMVKGNYHGSFSNQQYLDRMDEHVLSFYIDDSLNWYTANGILINGWAVVRPQYEEF